MAEPTALTVIHAEAIKSGHKYHKVVCMAIQVQNTDITQLQLKIQWLNGVRFQGVGYKIGSFLKIAGSHGSCHACIAHLIQVEVANGHTYVVVYRKLKVLASNGVPSKIVGKRVKHWQHCNRNALYDKKLSLDCLAFVDVHPCKLVNLTQPAGYAVVIPL